MVFGVRSIRVFSNFLLDPYYEPLLWFMIQLTQFHQQRMARRIIYRLI